MPTPTQLQNIWLLSDTVLYPEAVAFIHRLLREQGCRPLPNSQVAGLLSIAESNQYDELHEFILHQCSRNWPPKQRDIKTFYLALDESLTNMQQRLRSDFHLVAGGRKAGQQISEEEKALLVLLAHEFIQHLSAENGVLAAQSEDERRSRIQRAQPVRPAGVERRLNRR